MEEEVDVELPSSFSCSIGTHLSHRRRPIRELLLRDDICGKDDGLKTFGDEIRVVERWIRRREGEDEVDDGKRELMELIDEKGSSEEGRGLSSIRMWMGGAGRGGSHL